jgi:hypothetical protein
MTLIKAQNPQKQKSLFYFFLYIVLYPTLLEVLLVANSTKARVHFMVICQLSLTKLSKYFQAQHPQNAIAHNPSSSLFYRFFFVIFHNQILLEAFLINLTNITSSVSTWNMKKKPIILQKIIIF